jgi:cobalt/nickel transport protein
MSKSLWAFTLGGALLALALAAFLSPFASTAPDGLEKVAGDKGFLEKGEGPPYWLWALIPDYVIPGIRNASLATSLAGLLGTLLVLGMGYGLARLVKSRQTRR